jgi:type IV pilus assembly protein PilB
MSNIRTARETMILTARSRNERRATPRTTPASEFPVAFVWDERGFAAVLMDVSVKGAGLRFDGGDESALPPAGSVLNLTVKTSHETAVRKGRVVWVKSVGRSCRLGVEFVELPKDADCIGVLNMDRIKIDPTWALRVPASLALRRQVLPFASHGGQVFVACANLLDTAALQAVERLFSLPVRAEPAEPASLQRALDRVYGDLPQAAAAASQAAPGRSRSVDIKSAEELQPDDAVALCDELLHSAILRQASDIHIDPDRDGLLVRFRVDGALEVYRRLPAALMNAVISRFKVLGGMDIAEKRAPQDGGFKHRFGRNEQTIDIRTATLPTKYGERMTIRLLALQTESLTLERLGMAERDLACFEQAIARPHGLILLTGPTGSGKTTTLYAAIRKLMERERLNIITVEDPIEYEISGVAQVEVDAADKVTFGKALRSVLRHDPDVLMIGEIRDLETADVAIKASLTGHLVFSTLHTNSAVSVLTRLAHMGVERYLIAATLRLAVAQRLVRRLCPRCRKPRPLAESEAVALNRPGTAGQTVFEPVGCIYCADRGYIGRIALFELLPLDDNWGRLICAGAEEPQLIELMRQQKVLTLVDDAVDKLFAGETTVAEVLGAVAVW